MNNTYGWAIDLSITKTNVDDTDGKYIVAINLSLPGAREDNPDWLGNLAYATDKAFNGWIIIEQLVFEPFEWNNIRWVLYKSIGADNWAKICDLSPMAHAEYPTLKDAIIESLNHLPLRKHGSWQPFDLKNVEKNQTLVHSLAPLAYLPADVSSFLNMSFIAEVSNLEFGASYAVFPEFSIKTQDSKDINFSPKETIHYYDHSDSEIAYLDYPNSENNLPLRFYCNVEKHIAEHWGTLSLKEKTYNPVLWKSDLLTFLCPANLFAKAVFPLNEISKDKIDKNVVKSIVLALFRSIGAGWDISREETTFIAGTKNTIVIYENLLNVFINVDKGISFTKITNVKEKPKFLQTLEDLKNLLVAIDLSKTSDSSLSVFIANCNKLKNHIDDSKTDPLLDPIFSIIQQLQNQEEFKKISIFCWAKLNNLDDQILQKIIVNGISQIVIDNAQFALIVDPSFGEDANKEQLKTLVNEKNSSDLGNQKDKILAALLDMLSLTATISNEEIKKSIETSVEQELKSLVQAKIKAKEILSTTKPKDDGIEFSFVEESDLGHKDEHFRGYAVALQVLANNYDKSWGNATSAWITNVQLAIKNNKPDPQSFLHETIGATKANNKTVGSFEYTGNPLLASKASIKDGSIEFENKSDYKDGYIDTDYIDYVWLNTETNQPPKLGYGLWYRGIATPLGNAGEVLDVAVRDTTNPTKLISASDAISSINPTQVQQYLSCVPPGAPTVIFDAEKLTKLQELSEETKAYVYQTTQLKKVKPLPVALLTNDSSTFSNIINEISFEVLAPIPSFDFYEKWKNTDWYLVDDINKKKAIEIEIQNFKENLTAYADKEQNKYRSKQNGEKILKKICIHPAVSKLLIKVSFPGKDCELFCVDITSNLATINVALGEKDNALLNSQKLNITLVSESYCNVELVSLVESIYFDEGKYQKFNIQAFNGCKKYYDDKDKKLYYQFGPAEYWFEAAPTYKSTETVNFDTTVKYENEDAELQKKSYVELSIRNANTIDATWIRGVEFQRHEWHWTGYPVTFPEITGDFDKWLSSFVGVESYRQEDNYVLNSYIDGIDWKICDNKSQSVVVHQHQLASGPRPAKYIAFSVRPKIRFSKWIKSDAQIRKDIESKVFANGTLAKGIPIDLLQERIPVPPLKWAIPLTATYNKPTDIEVLLPERTQNGNLLIFDEAFKRTDSLVRFGGIGDTIDIEVMGTRIRDIHEFGVNPIFHGYENLSDQTLLCDEPFGLTYDITRNAKVAQTGMVVRPRLANGKWMLAKVRARRYVNPDTLTLDNLKRNDDGTIQVQVRKVGDSLVPIDFCIEFEKTTTLCSLKFGEKAYTGNPLKPATRFLVTFEKFEGKIGWKIGVTAQNNNNNLDYETIDRVSGLSDTPLIIDQISEFTKLEINQNKDIVCTVRPLVISDFTDPIWLSFIGSFGVEAKILDPTKCKITKNTDALIFESEIKWKNEKEETINLVQTFKKYDDTTDSRFQVLMVYEPVQDIYKTGKELDGGRFVGFYVFDSYKGSNASFVKTVNASEINKISNDAYAYLITFQKATAMKEELSSNLDLMSLLFPEPTNHNGELKPVESKIRITPEYMGPIEIKGAN